MNWLHNWQIFSHIFRLLFLIDDIKPNLEKKFKTCYFRRLFRGGESGAYKIKTILFLFAFGLLAATKYIIEKKREMVISEEKNLNILKTNGQNKILGEFVESDNFN